VNGSFDRLQTARLVLRRVADADVEHVMSVEADPATNAFCWNLYYRFKPAAWGRGYATEAAAAALRAAEAVAADSPIVARTRPHNEPSRRVAERLGLLHNPSLDEDGYVVLTSRW